MNTRGQKRLKRGDDVTEEFLGGFSSGLSQGSYLKISLKDGKSLKCKGWPWVQAGVKGVIGTEKVAKASLLRDGSLLVKTKGQVQTEKFMKVTLFAGEECTVERDDKLNVSKGTIHAYDLQELTEDEIVHWLQDFGVIGAKRFTKKVSGQEENTPTVLLTFNRPTCPDKIQLDYVTYHVKRHIPNPLICYGCGKYGHPAGKCKSVKKCLRCGEGVHTGDCEAKCMSCNEVGHACTSRECPVWQKEKEICRLKVENELSYAEARRLCEGTRPPPLIMQSFSSVVCPPTENRKGDTELKEKVEKLEKKIDDLTAIIARMAEQMNKGGEVQVQEVGAEGGRQEGDSSGSNKQVPKEAPADKAGSVGVGETPEATKVNKGSKQTEWKTAKGKKGKGKGGGDAVVDTPDAEMVDGDEIQSQVIPRKSRSVERSSSLGRRSWKDPS